MQLKKVLFRFILIFDGECKDCGIKTNLFSSTKQLLHMRQQAKNQFYALQR